MISITAEGGDPVRHFNRLSIQLDRAVGSAVSNTGTWLHAQISANADTGNHAPGLPHIPGTGPGPNVATGDYVRSIALEVTEAGSAHVATVSTNLPQARRLEFGFVGTDSLGRSYRQPPYPHWRPALFLAHAVLDREMSRALASASRRA